MKIIHKVSPKKAALTRALNDLDRLDLKVGWFESAQYANGTPVAYVASIQEYGDPTHNIPPRPFMRPTVAQRSAEWSNIMKGAARKLAAGEIDTRTVLEGIGLQAQGDTAATIAKLWAPALKESTVKARMRRYKSPGKKAIPKSLRKPLVDSSYMVSSLTHKVEEK